MGTAQNWVQALSQRLELPADILTGVPRMELIGSELFRMEAHQGLLEYDHNRICVASRMGQAQICGKDLRITLMNVTQITAGGIKAAVMLGEDGP